jgi:hypothetical protein
VIPKLKNFWHSLPPKVQTAVLVFESAAGTFLTSTASLYLLNPSSACWEWHCLRLTLAGSAVAGANAAKAFWMRPGPGREGGPVIETPATKIG